MQFRDQLGRFAARDAIIRDGMTNMLTGFGTVSDPRSYNVYVTRRLSDPQIAAAYRGGWVMRKLIDKPAREMVREWRNWQASPDDVTALEAMERKLGIRQKVETALQFAGLGGAGLILGMGPVDPMQPIDTRSVQKDALQYVHVCHRSRFGLGPLVQDPADPWFGQPSYYELNGSSNQIKLHPSRVVIFKGQPVPHMAAVSYVDAFWGDSTVEVVMDAVQNVDTAQNGFAALIKDARNRRLSIPRLTEQLATRGSEQNLALRVQALALGESMFGVTFLDAGKDGQGGEKLDDRQMVWTGIPQIADMYMTAAAGAADMPATVLWGKSPEGMNATGESDLQVWERTVKGRQDLDLRPCLDQLDAVLVPSAIGSARADAIGWEFRPLSVLTEAEASKAFSDFMDGFDKLVGSATIPMQALERMIQNKAIEAAWFPGTDAALDKLDEATRFPSSAPDSEKIGA